jgi:hypothetical protein
MLPARFAQFIATIREIAAVGGIGWVPVQTRLAGKITVMFSEINSRPDDEELMAFIQERCKNEQDVQL